MPERLGAAYKPLMSTTPQEDNPVRSTYNMAGPPRTSQPGMDAQAEEQSVGAGTTSGVAQA